MDSIFDPRVDRDVYLDHMRKTMEWIEEKMRDPRREPSHQGYEISISVEARWLQQLIAECVAKHQMLLDCQRRLGEAASALTLMRPVGVDPSPAKIPTSSSGLKP